MLFPQLNQAVAKLLSLSQYATEEMMGPTLIIQYAGPLSLPGLHLCLAAVHVLLFNLGQPKSTRVNAHFNLLKAVEHNKELLKLDIYVY